MDSIRIFLYGALALVGFLLYTDWQKMQTPEKPVEVVASQTVDHQDIPTSSDNTVGSSKDELPIADDATATVKPALPVSNSQQYITVKTDVLDILIDTKGGSIVQTRLLDYPVELNSKEKVELQSTKKDAYYIVQSGLISAKGSSEAPNHFTEYRSEKTEYVLEDGQDELRVPLYSEKNGIQVVKTYVFKKGDYLIQQQTKLENKSGKSWSGQEYRQIQRTDLDDSQPFIYTYTGGVYYNEEEKYEKVTYDDMEDQTLNVTADKGWAAMLQHYFMTAIIPKPEQKNTYYTNVVDKEKENPRYIIGLKSLRTEVAAGEAKIFNTQLYIGPKIMKRLRKIAPGLELAVDFGFLTIISKPMFLGLDFIHGFTKNWGWAIIILTLGLKLLFFPFANASYKSMAKMKKIMPEVQRLKDRLGDDRQRLAKEQMELFKKHKVNPVSGCLPMVIQMPFFMGLYWALLESVELRQAPFMLWIQDLSIPDPFFVLPVLMGLSMFITQKLNPPPTDPMQARMMQIMPIAFSVIFFLLPAGLVLYSVTNSTLSIIQQWVITRRINKTN